MNELKEQSHRLSQEKPVFDDSIDVSPAHALIVYFLSETGRHLGDFHRTLPTLLCTLQGGLVDYRNRGGGIHFRSKFPAIFRGRANRSQKLKQCRLRPH
jgi:hypothetical protein